MTSQAVVAVTGANGYVGSCITAALRREMTVIRFVRTPVEPSDVAWSFGSDAQELTNILRNHGVTHLVHAAWDMTSSRLTDLTASCVAGSQRLIEAAKAADVKSMIFISTISAFDGARSAYGRAKRLVETMMLDHGGCTLRLGLVYGDGDGGMFGTLRNTVRRSVIVPVIGAGTEPQYLLHEHTLAQAVLAALRGEFDQERQPVTIASAQPIPFRDLLLELARREGARVVLVPIPWRLLHAGLWTAERLGLRLSVRSDSVLSFVFQDRSPDFTLMRRHGIAAIPFTLQPGPN